MSVAHLPPESSPQPKAKKQKRQPHENYPTPPEVALAITQRVAQFVGEVPFVVEPSAGSGAFIRAARTVFPKAVITAVDIRPTAGLCLAAGADGFYCDDWLNYLRIEGGLSPGTLVIGNPPFRCEGHGAAGDLATMHVLATLDSLAAGSWLAFLLPLSYFGGQHRALRVWARRDLRAWFQLPRRPSFIGGGTANAEYAVFIWQAGFKGNAENLEPLWVEGRDRRRKPKRILPVEAPE